MLVVLNISSIQISFIAFHHILISLCFTVIQKNRTFFDIVTNILVINEKVKILFAVFRRSILEVPLFLYFLEMSIFYQSTFTKYLLMKCQAVDNSKL